MALTLLQAAEQSYNEGKVRESNIIANFAVSGAFSSVLPFRTIAGSSLNFGLEEKLPGVGTRGYNRGFEESTGEVRRVEEGTTIIGGDLDVDRELINEMGMEIRSQQEDMKVRALALYFDKLVIKGLSSPTSLEFNGLESRLGSGTQVKAAGNTSGGDPLSLSDLDWAYYQVDRPTHWVFPKQLAIKLPAAARDLGVSGTVNYTPDQLGYQQMTYAGLPILMIDQDNEGNSIMPFNEPAPGGGSPVCTSVYLVSIGPTKLEGIQTRNWRVEDLGELQTKPVYRTRVDWRAGISVMNPRSIARIWGIKDADFVK